MNVKTNGIVCNILLLGLSLMLLLPVQAFAQDPSADAPAKTPSPPEVVSQFTVFDPDFDYLEKGQGYLTDQGKQKVNIWGESYGTVRVDEIGVQLTLQRWTGSDWIDVYYGASVKESNAAYAYSSISNISVLSGYYYRTKSYHWIKKGSTLESGYRYSSAYLIPE
ncbi:hypothetical protein SAMN04488542_114123 [Fontibacillus panacisegetis]|uniref:Uncharacterized protein n=1 Tax=Fontibacillus panacisegetis TaxID=670482 RepID=A0A1G7MX92_9BACL|nr:hypothetical protein [Fontibacillus panacisegetis]SDF66364.1 hypothetical protein SAMN04488542_114123 [Fontibacillus panacisegetis]